MIAYHQRGLVCVPYSAYVGSCMCDDQKKEDARQSIGTRAHPLGSVGLASETRSCPVGLAVIMAQRVTAQVERVVLHVKPEWVPYNDRRTVGRQLLPTCPTRRTSRPAYSRSHNHLGHKIGYTRP